MNKKNIFLLSLMLTLTMIGCSGKKKDAGYNPNPYPTYDNRPSYPTTPEKKPVGSLEVVYYDFDKANIKYDQQSKLDNNAEIIKSDSSMNVTIQGHTDARGTNEYNMALGDRRARSARTYLINLGVDSSQLDTVSYGEERPDCVEQSESCWSLNRRAEFVK
jgi:peptidoglycan-associated lipoprotein